MIIGFDMIRGFYTFTGGFEFHWVHLTVIASQVGVPDLTQPPIQPNTELISFFFFLVKEPISWGWVNSFLFSNWVWVDSS